MLSRLGRTDTSKLRVQLCYAGHLEEGEERLVRDALEHQLGGILGVGDACNGVEDRCRDSSAGNCEVT